MQIHHLESVSTSLEKSVAQVFWAQDPFRATQASIRVRLAH